MYSSAVFAGDPPVFQNLPSTVSVNYSATVGTELTTFSVFDNNSLQDLNFSLVSILPANASFLLTEVAANTGKHKIDF